MPNKKISQLSTGSTLDGSELVPIVQGGVTKKVTTQEIADLGGSSTTPTLQEVTDEGASTTNQVNFNGLTDGLNKVYINPLDNGAGVIVVKDSANTETVQITGDSGLSIYTSDNNNLFVVDRSSGIDQAFYKNNEIATVQVIATATQTASNDTDYIVNATTTFTDPTPVEAKGFTVFVRNGTATVGGVAYSVMGTIIKRTYHSGSWSNDFYTENNATILYTHSSLNPADATTYFFGSAPNNAANTATTALRRGFAPFTGFIYSGLIQVQVSSVLGTTETATFKINNKTQATSVTISTSVKYDVIAAGFPFTITNGFYVNSGDSLEIEFTTPTFATNPTAVIHFVYLNFK
jgi:hypothetical protein